MNNAAAREDVAKALNHSLADSYLLMVKAHNYHWNVTGPQFHSLHTMFEEQYQDLFTAVDDLAERIRALGFKAPGGVKAFQSLSEIADGDEDLGAPAMVEDLIAGHEAVARTHKKGIEVSEAAGDDLTADLLIERATAHEKHAWMLRSMIA